MSDDKRPEQQGAIRPTGKRQLTGASTTSSTAYEQRRVVRVDDNKDAEGEKKSSPATFIPEVASEMKKVVWPTAKEMVQYTAVTFLFLIVLTLLVWGVDTLTGLGVEWALVR